MKKFEFKTHTGWFKAQFGKFTPRPIGVIEADLANAMNKVRSLQDELLKSLTYRQRFKATLYVWSMAQRGDIPRLKAKKNDR